MSDNTISCFYNKDAKTYTVPYNEMQKINRKLNERFELKQQNKQLQQALLDVKEYIDYYGITPEQNDDVILRHVLKNMLDIVNKALGGDDNE